MACLRELIPQNGVSRGSPRTAQDPDHGLAGRLVVLEKIQSFYSAFVSLGWRRTFNRSGRR